MAHLFKSRPGWGLPSARYARLGQAPSGFTEGMLHYLHAAKEACDTVLEDGGLIRSV